MSATTPPRLLVTGGQGRLAGAVVPAFERAGWDVVPIGREGLDVADRDAVHRVVADVAPDAVANLAAWTDLDLCERRPERAYEVNAAGVGYLAEACERIGAHLCHLSSDYVFDGAKAAPYAEDDPVAPRSVYGATKVASETAAGPAATVVRTAWVSGHRGPNIALSVLDQAADPTRQLRFVDDELGSPTVAEELAATLVGLVADRRPGCFHITNAGQATWFAVARHVLTVAGIDPGRVDPIAAADFDGSGRLRPSYSVLDNAALRSTGIAPLRHWEDAFASLVSELVAWSRA